MALVAGQILTEVKPVILLPVVCINHTYIVLLIKGDELRWFVIRIIIEV